MVHYTANCISRLDFLPRDEEWPGALLHLHAVHIYVRHVLWLQCMHICSEPLVRHYTPTRRRLQSNRRKMLKFMADGVLEAELISHSRREGSESRPPVSYCKMKCLRSFVNVLIDLCPQTGESGVVSRRLFSTPRDAFISCCWPALHPHYRTALPHTLPDCCNNFRHFYLPGKSSDSQNGLGA